MGIEPTSDPSAGPLNRFEDDGRHQPPYTPMSAGLGFQLLAHGTHQCRRVNLAAGGGHTGQVGGQRRETALLRVRGDPRQLQDLFGRRRVDRWSRDGHALCCRRDLETLAQRVEERVQARTPSSF